MEKKNRQGQIGEQIGEEEEVEEQEEKEESLSSELSVSQADEEVSLGWHR